MFTRLDPAFDPAAVRLLVYDLDGTLVDAFEDIWQGVNHALRLAHLPELPFEQVRGYVGDGAQVLIQRCLGAAHAGRFAEVYPAFRAYYIDNPTPTAHCYPGVLETLEALRAGGVQQAILSNKPHEVTLHTCAALGLAARLDGIWGEAPDRPRKPAAAALHGVLEHFGVAAAEAAMVGDGPADHKVAAAAGVPMLAVTWGLLPRAESVALRPAAVLDTFADLAALRPGGVPA